MGDLSRRSFLKTTAAAAVAGRTVSLGAAPAGPDMKFPTAIRDRLSVASWPFRAFIEAPANKWARDPKLPGMDLKDFGAMIMSKFSVRNIEPLDQHFRSTDPAYLSELRASTEKAGARIVDLPADPGASYYDPSPEQRAKAVAASRKWIDVAAAIGCPSVRLHIAGAKGVKPSVDPAVESLKQVAEYAASRNIIANLENDDNFTEDAFFIVEVLDKVKSPYLRALPDFCNSMLTHDQAFNDRAMRELFARAYNIAHVKDSEVGDKGKLFTVDVAKCFQIAKTSGYKGYYSMEWEGAGEPYAGTRTLIDLTLKYLA
jgi:sugar phosphate isomerase/epimerase